jgi:hypothetical protein
MTTEPESGSTFGSVPTKGDFMRALPAVILLLTLAACGADIATPDMSTVAGDYVLRTINGGGLPVVVINRVDLKLQIAAETLFMKPSGQFSDITHYIRSDSVGVVDLPADTLDGSWSIKGTVISYASGSNTFTGTLGGVAIIIEGAGLSFQYIK